MTLLTALEIACDCGLDTVEEAILNIRMHATSLFNYGEELREYKELCLDFFDSGLSLDDKICDVVKIKMCK